MNITGLDQLKISRAPIDAFDDNTLRLLGSNLAKPDVFGIFCFVARFRERGGFMKSYLPDWNTKRRRYDNAFLILEASKFIVREREDGPSEPYLLTSFGSQLILYLVNDLNFNVDLFKKLTDSQYEEFLKTRRLTWE